MTRILTAAVLLPLVIGVVWWLPPAATFVLCVVVAAIAFGELVTIARALGTDVWHGPGLALAAACCLSLSPWAGNPLVVPLMAVVLIGGLAVSTGSVDRSVWPTAASTLAGALYVGLPLGAVASIRVRWGAPVLLVLFLTTVISDTAQYYCGRTFGRRPLAPSISPKKTIEGAVGGVVITAAAMPFLGQWGLSVAGPGSLVVAGGALAMLGIVGDLFESQLKRSAGMKDSSALLPGHGGMLDRIDSLLFTGPVFYVLLESGLGTQW